MQADINIDRTGLGLCPMRSTLGELFVACSPVFVSVLLLTNIDLFTHHDSSLGIESVPLQACSYQETLSKSFPVNLAAKYTRHLNATAKPARNIAVLEVLADRHVQKFNIGFLTKLGWSAANISKAFDKSARR